MFGGISQRKGWSKKGLSKKSAHDVCWDFPQEYVWNCFLVGADGRAEELD